MESEVQQKVKREVPRASEKPKREVHVVCEKQKK